jgi:ElaB/YqjD/DUF883 family membrane-anchored ribosome-binding protein
MGIAILVLLCVSAVLFFILKKTLQTKKALELKNVNLATELNGKISNLSSELKKYEPIKSVSDEVARLTKEKSEITSEIDHLTERLKKFQFDTDVIELGYYEAKFDFEDLIQYVEALELTREAQRELIRQKKIFDKEGTKDFKDIAKMAVSAFNGEANAVIESVKYDNFEKSKEQIQAVCDKINTLLAKSGFHISGKYLELKIKELALLHDYREEERKTKDEQAALKATMREEEHARAEAERAREKAIEKQEQYKAAVEEAKKILESKFGEEREKFEAKLQDMERKYDEATAERERATAQAQITKSGHVYIISNIGSFGDNVFKIGMTRRLEPVERIEELSGAAVPFSFDVHALIKTDDAPGLETMLHHHFDEKRKNRVNPRKEFFNVTIDEVEEACKKFGHNARLTKVAEAREYRESVNLSQKKSAA